MTLHYLCFINGDINGLRKLFKKKTKKKKKKKRGITFNSPSNCFTSLTDGYAFFRLVGVLYVGYCNCFFFFYYYYFFFFFCFFLYKELQAAIVRGQPSEIDREAVSAKRVCKSYLSQRTTKPTIRRATSEALDQPAHPRSLIRVFANRMCFQQPPGYPTRDKR